MQARVVVLGSAGDVPALTYAVPPQFEAAIKPGCRVIVPVRSRAMTAMVIETGESLDSEEIRLKPIAEPLDGRPLFDSAHLKLLEFLASYYMTPLADAYRSVVPGLVRIESSRRFRIGRPPDTLRAAAMTPLEESIVEIVTRRPIATRQLSGQLTRQLPHADGREKISGALGRLIADGIILEGTATYGRHRAPGPRRVRFSPTAGEQKVRGRKQREIVAVLSTAGADGIEIPELQARLGNVAPALRSLSARGIIEIDDGNFNGAADGSPGAGAADSAAEATGISAVELREASPELSDEQKSAIDAVRPAVENRRFETFLLWGITASGKTEVYLHLAASALMSGRNAIVLVPEIALADQVVTSFRRRFGELVAIAHSGQNVAERWRNWMAALSGRARIMIGPRSAIFAPLHDPGIIVVDEEHDAAYKQEEGIRYNARDLAVALGRYAECPVVLGSATPSAESYANARSGRYTMLRLPRRVMDRPLAEAEVIDLRREPGGQAPAKPHRENGAGAGEAPVPLSAPLLAALRENLAAHGQTVLFLNRRGYHNFLQCHLCGNVIACPNCSVSMTFHLRDRSLRCHYCGERRAAPENCPECRGLGLEGLGFGTERLAAALAVLFPQARIERMDSDTSGRRGERTRILGALARGEIDILAGTQMITKGFDFPGVTLVGVILADMALNLPDFRSAERTFQLLTQVAGRAGRGERPGRVLIQTYAPHHYSIRAAREQDYARFMRRELELRRELGYPPYTRVALLRIESEDSHAASRIAAKAAAALKKAAGADSAFRVLGPAPAPIERIRQRYRFQVMVKSAGLKEMRAALNAAYSELRPFAEDERVRLMVDIDPVNML
ncbi:MAG: replication restart helicase PriA [Candidatus Binataceae bacterium]